MDEDPTAIPIFMDGKEPRIHGETNYGPAFDCPLITPVTSKLWQGGCMTGLTLAPRFYHVISLYPWERYKFQRARMDTEVYVYMYDSRDQGFEQVDALARLVNVCRQQEGDTLVHCQAGLNRSSLVIARALWLDGRSEGDGIIVPGIHGSGDDIVEMLRQKRSPAVLCNPSFEAEVRSW